MKLSQADVALLYAFFWAIPRRLIFTFQRFGMLCLFHLHRRVVILHTHPPMKMERTEYPETLAYKIQTPGNCPAWSIQHSEHGGSWNKEDVAFFIVAPCILKIH
jgi:hypothetical protein